MASQVLIRRADQDEADAVGALTERVYRDGGWADDRYAAVLRDGAARVREAIVLVALLDRLYEARGYVRRPERDWQVGGFALLAYHLDLA